MVPKACAQRLDRLGGRYGVGAWLVLGVAFECLGAPGAQAQATGFVTRQDTAEVLVVDLSDGSVLGSIPTVDSSPFEIAVSDDASELYVTGIGSNTVEFVDAAAAASLGSSFVGAVPIEVAVLRGGAKVYTADFFGGTVSVVDTTTHATIAMIATEFLCYDVAAAPDGARVYATSLRAADLFVIDAVSDTLVDRIPIGHDFLAHVAITPDGGRAYITGFHGRIDVVDLATRAVVGSIPMDVAGANPNNGALDIAVDPQGAFAYAIGYDAVNVIDLATDSLVATIPVGVQLSDLVVDASGASLYVTTLLQTLPELPFNEIVKIDAATRAIEERFVIGGLLVGLALAGPSSIGVTIDVKPGSSANTIPLSSKGVVAVAILTTEEFDAARVDPSTVRFGPAGARIAHVHGHREDVDGDGDDDLVLHFLVSATGIAPGDETAALVGETFDGQALEGSDRITVVRRGV